MENGNPPLSAVAAGHICVDLHPNLSHLPAGQFSTLFQPGRLINTGPMHFSTGGSVSNTGLALHRLGVNTRLMGKLGQDFLADIVRGIAAGYDPRLPEGLTADPGVPTSYTVVITPPDLDRIFLHCPGANDAFTAADLNPEIIRQAAVFHFGYPPLMRHMYQQGGAELARVMRLAREAGAATSLDMAFPDPSSPAGRAPWLEILGSALPYVDIFQPSIEELLFMLRRQQYEDLLQQTRGRILDALTPALLHDVSSQLLDMGTKIVALKLGDRGFYLRTSAIAAAIGRLPLDASAWADVEVWAPCFRVQVVGTTGSGDATIAGLLAAMLRGFSPRQAVNMAVAVGACNVEAADATSGIRTWEDTLARLAAGWPRLPLDLHSAGWKLDSENGVWSP